MKKYFTFIAFALFTVKLFAQDTIPNAGFERWSNDTAVLTGIGTKIPYNNPVGWYTPNALTLANGGKAEVTETDTAYSGKLAARLETQSLAGIAEVPGFILLGSVNTSTEKIVGGVPFTGRPDTLYGYYMYTPSTTKTDSCLIYAYLFKWNSTKKAEDTVGLGGFISGATSGNDTTYTKFAMPIYYVFSGSGEVPDSIQLAIVSSFNFYNSPPIGSTLFVDDLYFSSDTSKISGINSVTNKGFSVSCYPNPAKSYLNVLISEPQQGMLIKLYDILGRNLLTVNSDGLITSVPVSQLSSGTYFYEVMDKNGNSLKSEKFSVVK